MKKEPSFKQSVQPATDHCEFIMHFVKTSHNVSIAVLLSCLYRLQMVLLEQSFFLFEDIRRTVEEVVPSQSQSQSTTTTTIRSGGEVKDESEAKGEVKVSGERKEEEEEEEEQVMVVFYTGLVYELCVTPRMSMEGPRLGLLPPFDEAAVSEERLVQWLLQRLVERNEKEEGRYELLMEQMRLEARKYEVEVVEEVITSSQNPYRYLSNPNQNNHQSNINDPDSALASTSASILDLDLVAATAIERHEAVVRLLAHIRKSGMDIVFPQDLHDRVSLIYSHATSYSYIYN